jgi:deazaflavin-dependent oxidoreductase (nitroreductase family)
MPTKDQRSRPFVTPPRSEIPGISRMHVAAMLASDEGLAWGEPWMRNLLLRTVGRKSGREHDVALPYWEDDEDQKYIVASFSGAPAHPSWYLNLIDRTTNPEVWVKERGSTYWADAQVLDGDHQRIWSQLTVDRPHYNDYQANCERRIPLVRLVPLRPDSDSRH